jgi:GAF domain-containing protein
MDKWWNDVLEQAQALVHGEPNLLANLCNLTALLYHNLLQRGVPVNWVGFYVLRQADAAVQHRHDGAAALSSQDYELVLGPFQGKVACVRIALGRGVCGTAAASRKTLLVDDVRLFPGHIACDPVSLSECVVPVVGESGELLGVLDVDCSSVAALAAEDARGLERVCQWIGQVWRQGGGV